MLELTVNGKRVLVREGTTVAAAVLIAGVTAFRRSVNGEPRGPLCGMGICFECRVAIDGVLHERSCMVQCAARMDVRTDG